MFLSALEVRADKTQLGRKHRPPCEHFQRALFFTCFHSNAAVHSFQTKTVSYPLFSVPENTELIWTEGENVGKASALLQLVARTVVIKMVT